MSSFARVLWRRTGAVGQSCQVVHESEKRQSTAVLRLSKPRVRVFRLWLLSPCAASAAVLADYLSIPETSFHATGSRDWPPQRTRDVRDWGAHKRHATVQAGELVSPGALLPSA